MRSFDSTVVGLQYRVTASTRRLIQKHIEAEGPIDCLLIREPDNVHDENAIKVKLRSSPYKGMHIGYISRPVASVYASALDEMAIRVKSAHITYIDADRGLANATIRFVKVKPGVKTGSTKRKKKKSSKGA